MEFDYTPDEQAFIRDVRAFLKEEARHPEAADIFAPNRESDAMLSDTPARRKFNRRMAQRGFLGMSWPVEYGGQGKPGIYEYLLNEELARVGAPLIGKGVGCIGQTLIRHGSDKLKTEFLPQILQAEIEFALGYTEPHAGSDLAALKLRATREDDGWRLNGQKMFTTSAHFADWYWLAARTDPEANKYQGISLFLLPMRQPGITVHAIHTLGEHRTNQVFIEDVFVHSDYLVGAPNKGWRYICEALDYERFTLYPFSPLEEKFARLTELLRGHSVNGKPVLDIPNVRRRLAHLAADVEMVRMLQFRVVSAAMSVDAPTAESAMFKLFATELHQRLSNAAMDILGPDSLIHKSDEAAPAGGKWEWSYRATTLDTIGAGSSEIQKNIIARRALGLPLEN